MIIVTGAAGFIGSCLIARLHEAGYHDIVAVDKFGDPGKEKNLEGKALTARVDRDEFVAWIDANHRFIQLIFHLGARTDTTEFDREIFKKLNLDYSKTVWNKCVEYGLPLVYASSAATYGEGEHGYDDDHDLIPRLKPLNPYGESKNDFDLWALQQKSKPYFWAGLKFFNVYGPNEYHKGRMASVIMHAHSQISKTGGMKLFRSHRAEYPDGGQLRDFVYVKDVADVCLFLMTNRKHPGIYNLGTGRARTFFDLASAVFRSMNKPVNIQYIDIPEDIRDKYQYYTKAEMGKLRKAGYSHSFTPLEDGIDDYVTKYLANSKYY